MGKCRINLSAACCYLNALPPARLDGVWEAVTAKMDELGVSPNKRAHKAPEMTGETQPTGNIRGILRFIESADKDDAEALQAIHAVVRSKTAGAGYKPKATPVEPAPSEPAAE